MGLGKWLKRVKDKAERLDERAEYYIKVSGEIEHAADMLDEALRHGNMTQAARWWKTLRQLLKI